MRSPITCCFTSPLNPLMLRLIIVTSYSSSNPSSLLLSLRYCLFAVPSHVVAPVFDSLSLPRFCCGVVGPLFDSLYPSRFCRCAVAPVLELLFSPRFCCCVVVLLQFFSSSFTVADTLFLSFFLWYVAFVGVPFFEELEPIFRCSCSGVKRK